MAYQKQDWYDLPNKTTPISATRLGHIENGIYDNSLKADQVGDLTQLDTTEKSTLVGAINEVNSKTDVYSTTQKVLTNKTLDGKPVYRAYLDFAHFSAGNYTYNHNLGIDKIVSVEAFCTIANQTISSNGYRIMPVANYSGNYFAIDTIKENSITTISGGWTNNHAYIWIEYTEAS